MTIVSLSPNTQAILLLTSPLQVGRSTQQYEILTHGEYKRLAQFLRGEGLQPADLLAERAQNIIQKAKEIVDPLRLQSLLARGFQLSQAVEHWQTRAIWVVSRADVEYPRRIKSRLKDNAPAIFYGCGSKTLLDSGGLAVVGSRHADDTLIQYTEDIGHLAAQSSVPIVSGGARGIDQAAMRGALDNGGRVIGVLADSLERAALNRENRNFLMEDQLVLISPYHPSAGLHVGTAMARNKLIYAFADAALVVNSDLHKGGTWAGATEQLEKLHLTPVYVRVGEEASPGLRTLRQKGALPWPEPQTPEELLGLLSMPRTTESIPAKPSEVALSIHEEAGEIYHPADQAITVPQQNSLAEGEEDEAGYQLILGKLSEFTLPKKADEIAAELGLPAKETKRWLDQLVREKLLLKKGKPARYFTPEEEFSF